MPRAKREKSWKTLGLQIEADLYEKLKEEADADNRTLTATLEMILKEHYAKHTNKG